MTEDERAVLVKASAILERELYGLTEAGVWITIGLAGTERIGRTWMVGAELVGAGHKHTMEPEPCSSLAAVVEDLHERVIAINMVTEEQLARVPDPRKPSANQITRGLLAANGRGK